MTYKLIEVLLKDKTGLHSDSIGSETIKVSIKRRMSACSIIDASGYYSLIHQSTDELQSLINEAMVPETWFFRDDMPFRFLKNLIRKKWLSNHQKKKLRILNIPCATGEEPYSVAMTLLSCGMRSDQFSIDAIDINTWALNRASEACYSQHSFRGDVINQYLHYFEKLGNKYQLSDVVKGSVQFSSGNILDERFIRRMGAYDIVFCRNLLIYFDDETKQKVVSYLSQLMLDQGILFVGYADVSALSHHSFTPVPSSNTFAFYKKEASQLKPKAPLAHKKQTKEPPEKVVMIKALGGDDTLDHIQALADQGDLDEAKLLCQQSLKQNMTSVRAHYLMGVILEVQEQWPEAHSQFCKTLYLDPKHYGALAYLATHAERKGDMAGAKVYRLRANRILQKKTSPVL